MGFLVSPEGLRGSFSSLNELEKWSKHIVEHFFFFYFKHIFHIVHFLVLQLVNCLSSINIDFKSLAKVLICCRVKSYLDEWIYHSDTLTHSSNTGLRLHSSFSQKWCSFYSFSFHIKQQQPLLTILFSFFLKTSSPEDLWTSKITTDRSLTR